jgi:hypothetical protein
MRCGNLGNIYLYNNPSFNPDSDNWAAKYQKMTQRERAIWSIFQVAKPVKLFSLLNFRFLLDKVGKTDTNGLPQES